MISIVVPCYNEKEVLDQLYQRLLAAAESWGEPFEVIVVDDGSEEDTWRRIEAIHQRDPRWKAVRFSRNFGHQTAVSAGIARAAGEAVIVMDADLQDPPEELHRFLARWREGYDVVYGVRRKRKEGPLLRLCYHLFYRILAGVASQPIPTDSGDFCLMDRKVVDLLNAMPERNRFVRGLRAWVGFRQVGIEYARDARRGGEPKYTLARLVRLAVDGLFSFSTVPLRLATYLGLVVSTVAFLGAAFTFVQKVFEHWFEEIGLNPERGFPTIVIAVLFLGGVQLICLGIIGEYIGRIYDEVKGRPSWVVRQTLGLPSDDRGTAVRGSSDPAQAGEVGKPAPSGAKRDQETG